MFAPTLPTGLDLARLDRVLIGLMDGSGRCLGLGALEHDDGILRVLTNYGEEMRGWASSDGGETWHEIVADRVDEHRGGSGTFDFCPGAETSDFVPFDSHVVVVGGRGPLIQGIVWLGEWTAE